MKNARFRPWLAVVGASALFLTACSGGGGDTGEAGVVAMYTSNNETTVGVIVDAANDRETPLKVEAVSGSSGPLLQRIRAEADNPAADIFYSAPAAALAEYEEFIEPYRSPEADDLPEELLDPEDRWVPTNTHVVALMVNTQQIDDGVAPRTWKELSAPSWQGKIIVADPTQSTTALTALYGAYKVLSEDDFAQLVSNLEVTENSSNVYPAVAQGEFAVSIAYESNIYPYIAGGQEGVEMIYPEDGTFVEHDAAMIVKDGPNPQEAQALIDTILAKETQEENLTQSFRRPVRTDIDPSDFVDFLPLDELNIVDIHGAEDEQGRDAFLELFKGM